MDNVFSSFFASYAVIGLAVMVVSLLVSLALYLILFRITKKNNIAMLSVLLMGAFFYFIGMIATALLYLGLFVVGIVLGMVIKKFKTNNY